MKLKTYVKSLDREFVFDTDNIDRNYADENYAVWVERLESGLVLEVNIFKQGNKLHTDGCYYLWKSMGHFEDDDMYGTINEGVLRFSKVN